MPILFAMWPLLTGVSLPRSLFALLLLGCGGNPIESCGSLSVDCCTSDADCADYFGSAFPYCYNPGDNGVCAECLTANDCASDEQCFDDAAIGAFCDIP